MADWITAMEQKHGLRTSKFMSELFASFSLKRLFQAEKQFFFVQISFCIEEQKSHSPCTATGRLSMDDLSAASLKWPVIVVITVIRISA